MQAFARWIGMMAAGGAALLAVVWLLEARPDREAAGPASFECSQARFRLGAFVYAAPTPESRAALEEVRRLCPPEPRTHWDEPLAMRGLAAGAVAVALLLLSARIGRIEHG